MNALSQDCRSVAQNEYMIDSSFLPVGRLLNDSANEIERLNEDLSYACECLEGCRKELREVTTAMGDPAISNLYTLEEAVRKMKAENVRLLSELRECRKRLTPEDDVVWDCLRIDPRGWEEEELQFRARIDALLAEIGKKREGVT
jgi:hypothetical protein